MKNKIKILNVVGARPNFMKVAPVIRALAKYKKFSQDLVHTGQHYDSNMSDVFFKQLGIPKPNYALEVGSGTHTIQTAQIMTRFEEVLDKESPDLVLVYGDVNSTVAAALVCAKKQVKIGHVEAGLRSFDRGMPEEINRIITDHLCDYLFTPSRDGDANLSKEGISKEKIFFVGNVMIDTLMRIESQIEAYKKEGIAKEYLQVSLHRPSNVDNSHKLKEIINELEILSRDTQVVFPIHPRTKARLEHMGIDLSKMKTIMFTPPLGYMEFMSLQKNAKAVLTDSGGIQEETTYLGVPCFTLRENTERPVTIKYGTNRLIGCDPAGICKKLKVIRKTKKKVVPLWDGRAAERIAKILNTVFN